MVRCRRLAIIWPTVAKTHCGVGTPAHQWSRSLARRFTRRRGNAGGIACQSLLFGFEEGANLSNQLHEFGGVLFFGRQGTEFQPSFPVVQHIGPNFLSGSCISYWRASHSSVRLYTCASLQGRIQVWKTAIVHKRSLRVVKWLGTIPVTGVCTFCNRQFKVPMTAMKRVSDAQESLRLQFTEHKCKPEETSASSLKAY
jgi:hypothetical protein